MFAFLVSMALAQTPATDEARLDAIAAVHGAAAPWAVAGYRMGQHALSLLKLPSHSHQLQVTHRAPRAAQFACVIDGAQVATGASVGKLNLSLETAPLEVMETIFTNSTTGETVTLRPAKAFIIRFTNSPRERARENGKVVLSLPMAEVFEVVARSRDGGR